MKGLLSPFLASLSRLVVLAYPFNRNHRPFDMFNEGGEGRRVRRAYLPSRWRPTDSGYLFAQGASHGEALLRSQRALPRLRPSRALSPPPIKRLSTEAPPREETARAFIPMPCTSPRAFLHALHDETCGPEHKFKRSSSLPETILIIRVISIIHLFFSRKKTESGKGRLNCN